jgi:predicted nucleic acid-binding protein
VVKRVGIDANVIVSLVTDRDPGQTDKARRLFAASRVGDVALLLPQCALAESVYVLRKLYRVPMERIAQIFVQVVSLPGVTPVHVCSWETVFELWPVQLAQFGDALAVAVAHHAGATQLATFDRALGREAKRFGLSPYWPV